MSKSCQNEQFPFFFSIPEILDILSHNNNDDEDDTPVNSDNDNDNNNNMTYISLYNTCV